MPLTGLNQGTVYRIRVAGNTVRGQGDFTGYVERETYVNSELLVTNTVVVNVISKESMTSYLPCCLNFLLKGKINQLTELEPMSWFASIIQAAFSSLCYMLILVDFKLVKPEIKQVYSSPFPSSCT